MKPKLCVSSSVLNFRERAERIWGLERYDPLRDKEEPVVFFGLYHIGDYFRFLKHRGNKIVFWCGDDIMSLKKKYLFSNGSQIALSKIFSIFPWYKIFRLDNVINYVENEVERDEFREFKIEAKIRPSFLEDVNDFPVSFKPSDNPQVFLSGWTGREEEYGLSYVVDKLAKMCPDITFHLYGMEWKWKLDSLNVVFHGLVPEDQFNEEIKNYHCGLRINQHDGFSEILAKSILMGQYPISRIKYPMIESYETEEELIRLLKGLKDMKEPNLKGREYYRKILNDFPWMEK